jgi:hypothetical protein
VVGSVAAVLAVVGTAAAAGAASALVVVAILAAVVPLEVGNNGLQLCLADSSPFSNTAG